MHTITTTAYVGISEPVLTPQATITSISTSISAATATITSNAAVKQCTGSQFWCAHELLIGILFAFAGITLFALGLLLPYLYGKFYKPRHGGVKVGKLRSRALAEPVNRFSMNSYDEPKLERGKWEEQEDVTEYGGEDVNPEFGFADPNAVHDDGVGYLAPTPNSMRDDYED